MLVRFLSFVASIIGTARYKAALLSSLALIVSLTSITVVALNKEETRGRTPDSVTDKSEVIGGTEATALPIPKARKQTKLVPAPEQTAPSAETPAESPKQQIPAAASDPVPAPVIVTDKSDVTLAAGTAVSLSAELSDKSVADWTASNKSSDPAVTITPAAVTGTSFQFTVSAAPDLPAGSVVTLSISAVTGGSAVPAATIRITIQ